MEDPFHDILQDAVRGLSQHGEMFGDRLILTSKFPKDFLVPKSSDTSLSQLSEDVRSCRKCTLHATRTKVVFGVGNPCARLLVVGEAPGQDEDLKGEPFVGKAGKLLDQILSAIGFERKEVFIGNVLKCRPPGNRDPLPEEMACCLPYLNCQIELIRPGVILALGRIAGQALLNTFNPLSRLRGQVHDFHGVPLVVTYHPAALLRNPQWKRPTWEDVQMLRRLYDQKVGDKPEWRPVKK